MKNKLKGFLRSEIHRKILLFFVENQGSVDTPRGVSAWVNENIEKVRVALEELAKEDLLKAHRTSSTVGYSSGLSKKDLAEVTSALKQ
ncbi:MAG: hypothetical protein HYZ87_02880 [Candidatus Omnitrophica bacterium]|nr:hypothetical protein [Candidatus Omnitrophota bacterium]